MGLSKISMIFFLMMMASCGVSMGDVYNVGDTAGWSIMSNVDYNEWSSSKNFHVGDTLLFQYNEQFHNVMQVTLQDFQSCNTMSPIALYSTGKDSIKIQSPGHYYFLCGVPGHCEAGQKVDVMATSVSDPTTSPSPSPPLSEQSSSPSPSPSGAALSPSQNSATSFSQVNKIGLFVIVLVVLSLIV